MCKGYSVEYDLVVGYGGFLVPSLARWFRPFPDVMVGFDGPVMLRESGIGNPLVVVKGGLFRFFDSNRDLLG